jgi:hypothetical protein
MSGGIKHPKWIRKPCLESENTQLFAANVSGDLLSWTTSSVGASPPSESAWRTICEGQDRVCDLSRTMPIKVQDLETFQSSWRGGAKRRLEPSGLQIRFRVLPSTIVYLM